MAQQNAINVRGGRRTTDGRALVTSWLYLADALSSEISINDYWQGIGTRILPAKGAMNCYKYILCAGPREE